MKDEKDVMLNGQLVKICRFDRVAFKPYSDIYYPVHGFDVYSDKGLMCVYDGNDIISRNIDDLCGVLKIDKRQTWQDRRKNRNNTT